MKTAQEILENIANALGVKPEEKEQTQETVVEEKEEPKTEEVVEEQQEVEEEVEVESKEEETEEVSENEEETISESENNRIKELESTIDSLKEMLAQGLLNEKKEEKVQEVKPVEEPVKPLTHSPEASIERKNTKIGDKGDNIMSRVYKYMNR